MTVRFGMRDIGRTLLFGVAVFAACLASSRAQGKPKVAAEPASPGPEKIRAAIDGGCRYLLDARPKSAFFGDQFGPHLLTLLALLHSDVSAFDPKLAAALRLITVRDTTTYCRGLRLMVIELLKRKTLRGDRFLFDELLLRTARADAAALVASQTQSGGYSYAASGQPGQAFDNSNTQYGVLGLGAAADLGIEIPAATWKRIVDHFAASVGQDGGAGYTGADNASLSMTTACLSSLAIAAARLEKNDPRRLAAERLTARNAAYLERAWAPRLGSFDGYFLYGLERAMGLSGRQRLGERDWYATGTAIVVGAQEKNGSWGSNAVSTSFALLFLTRPHAKPAETKRSAVARVLGALPREAGEAEILAAADALTILGKAAGPEIVPYLAERGSAHRTAAHRALLRLFDLSEVDFDPTLDPKASAAAREQVRAAVEKDAPAIAEEDGRRP